MLLDVFTMSAKMIPRPQVVQTTEQFFLKQKLIQENWRFIHLRIGECSQRRMTGQFLSKVRGDYWEVIYDEENSIIAEEEAIDFIINIGKRGQWQ